MPLLRLAVLYIRRRHGMGGPKGSSNYPPSEVAIKAGWECRQGGAGVCCFDDVLCMGPYYRLAASVHIHMLTIECKNFAGVFRIIRDACRSTSSLTLRSLVTAVLKLFETHFLDVTQTWRLSSLHVGRCKSHWLGKTSGLLVQCVR